MNSDLKAPFYYSFSIVRIADKSLEVIGKIESQNKEFPGIFIKKSVEGLRVFILPSLPRSVTYLFSGAEES